MSGIKLDILFDDKRWRAIPGLRPRLQKAARATYQHLPKAKQRSLSITLLLTRDARVRKLNLDFRGLDKPTNVLSFPQFGKRELTKMGKSRSAVYAGDIVPGQLSA